ncbi:hypothetical protein QC334_15395 [Streptomyces sp. DH18]|uniref:hypothetical protein n=1 Tax=Streptomyces sp. DH18 TaxID=3040126 RepID=UPI0024424123|nr:hypothetical protein [Streptomyces sp. DH18]MDG9684097.1 hypothetical protein [Streptomyces sp. DH18]
MATAQPRGDLEAGPLTVSRPGYCLHEPLRRHNRRSAALQHRVAAIGADHAIRHFAPSDVEHWLDLAEQRVG